MRVQSEENRQKFLGFAALLTSMGARVDIRVNGSQLGIEDLKIWPRNWRDFRVHVTKMPVVEDGNIDYPEVAFKWGSLLIGMILSLTSIVPIEDEEELGQEIGFAEGDVQRIEINRYERNCLNRKLCLADKGYDCTICGMNFEEQYGKLGHLFIHVHHIVPVSQLGSDYIINPIRDLIPVYGSIFLNPENKLLTNYTESFCLK